MRLFFFAALLFCLSCNLDANTVDPQASENIKASIQNNVFVKEYKIANTQSTCIVNEAWVEYPWKNEISNGKKTKKLFSGTQLILSLDLSNFPLSESEYLITWEVSDSLYGIFGRGNGVFILDLNKNSLPNEFRLNVKKRKDNKENICTIFLNAGPR